MHINFNFWLPLSITIGILIFIQCFIAVIGKICRHNSHFQKLQENYNIAIDREIKYEHKTDFQNFLDFCHDIYSFIMATVSLFTILCLIIQMFISLIFAIADVDAIRNCTTGNSSL
jgi:ABC-type sugar transport system permease subunit